ncbi:Inositol monophosphatase 3 [Coelomomyces lativittatus]|nr:Inositol monophosphatase 3 [Coelomomyces lativittatus]
MSFLHTKRLHRELTELIKNPPVGIKVLNADSLTKWIIQLDGAEGSLYENESYKLQFLFPSDYPIDAPEVVFIGERIPIHPHVCSFIFPVA